MRNRARRLIILSLYFGLRTFARYKKSSAESRIILQNSGSQKDGSGAQVQRIASIYSIASDLKLGFLLKDIEDIEIQHGDVFFQELEVLNFISELNSWLKLVGNSIRFAEPSKRELVILNSSGGISLCIDLFKALKSGRHLIVSIESAQSITNVIPQLYKEFTDAISVPNQPKTSISEVNVLSIQIHLRVSTFSKLSDRENGINYFKDSLDQVTKFCEKLNLSYSIGIHTDCWMPSAPMELLLSHASTATMEYWKRIGIIDKSGQLNPEIIDMGFGFIDELGKSFKNVHLFERSDPITAWNLMRSADVLITTKSSFSFIGAILNRKGLIIVPAKWVSPLKSWCTFKNSKVRLLPRLERMLDNRN